MNSNEVSENKEKKTMHIVMNLPAGKYNGQFCKL